MAIKQHYVPQLLLRKWSRDGASINVYQLDKNEPISKASIKGQAQERYYYGKDQKIENLYQTLETEVSPVINKLLSEDIKLTMEEKRSLYHFIAIQNSRTPRIINILNDNATVMAKNYLKLSKKFKDKENVLDSLKVSMNHGEAWQLLMYLHTIPALLDLQFILLRADENNPFVIGQAPVFLLNPYLYEKKWPESRNGIGLKGVFLGMPISPLYTICLYDNSTYAITGNSKIISLSNDEINLINLCQFYSTENSIYYYDWNESFRLFNAQSQEYRKNEKVKVQNFQNIHNENDILSIMSNIEYPVEPKFSFLGFKQMAYFTELTKSTVIRQAAVNAHEWAAAYYKTFPGMEKVIK